MYKIVGMAGTFCSGKDAAGEYLEKQYNYLSVTTSDFLRQEAKRRGVPVTRTVLQDLGDELRGQHGRGVLAEMALKYYQDFKQRPGLVIAGIRNPGEADVVHKEGGIILFIDAPSELRWQRMQERSRDDQETTLEEFRHNEKREIKNKNPAAINYTAVKSVSDSIIYNNDTLERFYELLEAAVTAN